MERIHKKTNFLEKIKVIESQLQKNKDNKKALYKLNKLDELRKK